MPLAIHQPDEDVEAILADLARRGVFIHARGLSWPDGTITSALAFDHDLYRDVVYGRVGVTQTAGYHLRIGSPGGRPPVGAGAARLEASPCTSPGRRSSTARSYRLMAADDQLQRSAHREAIDHLHAAAVLLLTRLPDDPTHLEEAVHVQWRSATHC